MEKDQDERIVQNGLYREALNISVSTSEGSDVGSAQNILGNIRVSEATKGLTQDNATLSGELINEGGSWAFGGTDKFTNNHIAVTVDPQTDKLYRFVNSVLIADEWSGANSMVTMMMDRIVEFDTSKPLDANWQVKESAVMVDIYYVKDVAVTPEMLCNDNSGDMIRFKLIPAPTATLNKKNQLRWGMRVFSSDANGVILEGFITNVDYVSGWIYVQTNSIGVENWTGGVVEFFGDRNLNFDPDRNITGINILDGMIFWTDNYSEPKKVNIKRSKMGSNTSLWSTTPGLIGRYQSLPVMKIDDFLQHTVLIADEKVTYDCAIDDLVCDDGSGWVQSKDIDDPIPPPEPVDDTNPLLNQEEQWIDDLANSTGSGGYSGAAQLTLDDDALEPDQSQNYSL